VTSGWRYKKGMQKKKKPGINLKPQVTKDLLKKETKYLKVTHEFEGFISTILIIYKYLHAD